MILKNIDSYMRIINNQKTVLFNKEKTDEAYKEKNKFAPKIAWKGLTD